MVKVRDDSTKINTNGFHWIPADLVKNFSFMRCYISTQWVWRPAGLFVEPSWQASANYDTYFKQMKDLGVIIVPCINQSPDWLLEDWPQNYPNRPEIKPIPKNSDPLDPMSYSLIGKFFFQWSARYGRVTYPDDILEVDPTSRWTGDGPNVKKSGKNWLDYIEVWNEPDGWWRQPEARFTPEEYACMLSVCYDGHEGLIPFCGIKAADQSMKVVMGGLSSMNVDYLQGMLDWFRANRSDQKFAADVINFHHYSNEENGPGYMPQQWTKGCSPEQDNLRLRLKTITDWRKQNVPKAKVWYSEFGYDTNPNGLSWQKSLGYNGKTGEKVQSEWLCRIYLESLAAKIDNMFMFNFIDEPCYNNGGLWCSAGMCAAEYSPTPFAPKASFTHITSLIKELKGYRFSKDLSLNNVRVYVFTNLQHDIKFVYWTVDGNNEDIDLLGTLLSATGQPKFFEIKSKQDTDIDDMKV